MSAKEKQVKTSAGRVTHVKLISGTRDATYTFTMKNSLGLLKVRAPLGSFEIGRVYDLEVSPKVEKSKFGSNKSKTKASKPNADEAKHSEKTTHLERNQKKIANTFEIIFFDICLLIIGLDKVACKIIPSDKSILATFIFSCDLNNESARKNISNCLQKQHSISSYVQHGPLTGKIICYKFDAIGCKEVTRAYIKHHDKHTGAFDKSKTKNKILHDG